MSDATPLDEPDEVDALTGHAEHDEGATPDARRTPAEPEPESDSVEQAEPAEPGDAATTDATGQDVSDAGTGTADTSDDPDLDPPD